MSNREILQMATSVFKSDYPSLNAEAVIVFIVIADLERPTIPDISLAIGLPDMQVFQHTAPLKSAGLIAIEAQSNGQNVFLLTEQGEQAKQAIADLFSG